jgi:hypothetical protein
MLDEIGLTVPEHPDSERHMEHPGKAHQPKQPPMERRQVPKHADAAVKGDNKQAIDREEIGRERDPEIVCIGDDMSAVTTYAKPRDSTAHDPHPNHVRQLMAEEASAIRKK